MAKLKITDKKGFQLSFENNLVISIQFGPGNYCDNYHAKWKTQENTNNWESTTAEIAIFHEKTGEWLTNKFLPKKRGKDVVGYVKPDEIASLIRRVQRYKQK